MSERAQQITRWVLLVAGLVLFVQGDALQLLGVLIVVVAAIWNIVHLVKLRKKKEVVYYARLVKTNGDKPQIVGPFPSTLELNVWYQKTDNWEGVKNVEIFTREKSRRTEARSWLG